MRNRLSHRARSLMFSITAVFAVHAVLLSPATAQAQAHISTEERFHDLFVTAGYSTAFGAALGAALLSFTPNPASELRYVAIGASLGFIGGSVLGTYMIFQPMWAAESTSDEEIAGTMRLLPSDDPVGAVRLTPTLGTKSGELLAVQGALTLARF